MQPSLTRCLSTRLLNLAPSRRLLATAAGAEAMKLVRVAVSGAGPAGLVAASTLSRSLSKPGFKVDVFERDCRDRDQGAGWDISTEAKQAFEKAGLDWRTIAREGSDTWRVFKVGDASPLWVQSLPEVLKRWVRRGRPETNRHAMREGLLAALGDRASVHFSCAVNNVERLADGQLALTSQSGEALGTYDIVIDASGMHSSLRRLRIDEAGTKQYYTGLTMINGVVDDPETMLDPQLVHMLGQGTLEIIGDCAARDGGFVILLQRYGSQADNRRTKLMSVFVGDHPGQLAESLKLEGVPLSHIDVSSHPAESDRIKRLLKAQLGDLWPNMYHDLIDVLEPLQVYDLYQYPSEAALKDDAPLGLVCIGDALHAMSPFSGSGGNLAVEDAAELAAFLIDGYSKDAAACKAGLREQEKKFLNRMAEPAKRGQWNTTRFKGVLEARTPIREWSAETYGKQMETIPIPFVKYVLKLFQFLHRREGYGMPIFQSRL